MSGQRHWAAIGESGTILGMQILILAYRIGGRWLLKVFLAPVILFYFIFRPFARSASNDFLTRAYQQGANIPKPQWHHSLAHLWQFGLSIIDKFAVWIGRIPDHEITLSGTELIDNLQQSRQGAVIFISHLGNFEICQALSRRHPNLKLCAFHHTRNSEKFNRLLRHFNDQNPVEILQVSEINAATAINISDKINRGEFVAIAGDRVPIDNPAGTLTIDFMGAPALFPKGPFALAVALKAPVLFLTCIRLRDGYHVIFEQLEIGAYSGRERRKKNIEQLATDFTRRLQHYCLQAPSQWFNFYAFWQQPSSGAAPGNSAPANKST